MVDLDPQGNALALGLGFLIVAWKKKYIKILLSRENKLIGSAIFDIKEIPNLSLISSVVDLSAAEIKLSQLEQGKFALKSALEKISDKKL